MIPSLMSDNSRLYADGNLYDIFFPAPPEESAFYTHLASGFAKGRTPAVLELGCGTGRLAIPLAQAGFAVTGVDMAAPMLAQARRKARAAGADVAARCTWAKGDMRALDLGKRFGLIIIPSNNIAHMHRDADMKALDRVLRHHLLPGGRVMVDLQVPDLPLLTCPSDESFIFAQGRYADGSHAELLANQEYEKDRQITHLHMRHRPPGQRAWTTVDLALRMFFPRELDLLLQTLGWFIEAKWGTYHNEPFGPQSDHQLVLMTRA